MTLQRAIAPLRGAERGLFIRRRDFKDSRARDLTAGANFDHDRGNVAVSIDYLNRGAITQSQVKYAVNPLNESCVTPATFSKTLPGTANGASAACLVSAAACSFISVMSTRRPIVPPSAVLRSSMRIQRPLARR